MKRKKRPQPRASSATLDPLTHPHAAGIDVGAEEFVAAVPPGRCPETVRSFPSFTSGVEALRDWLLDCGITTAAMEPKPPPGIRVNFVALRLIFKVS